jgi:transcriptional regulator with XRE-family HTH domain
VNKLKQLRIDKGLSIRQLASQANVGINTVVRLEQDGKAYATTLAKLAKFFEVPYTELAEFEAVNPKSK